MPADAILQRCAGLTRFVRFQDYTRPEHKHRISGLLRVRADALTIRQRKAVGRCKLEMMKWWLLLKEELGRSGGVFGSDPRDGPISMVDVQRTVADPFFMDLDARVSSGDVVGILDDDGFTCPEIGNECVSAHGVTLDLAQFARKVLFGFMSLIDARFPVQTMDEVPVHSHLILANTQRRLCERFASEWSEALCEVGRHWRPEGGQVTLFCACASTISRSLAALMPRIACCLAGCRGDAESESRHRGCDRRERCVWCGVARRAARGQEESRA